jgi:cytochrome c oxidase assembly protein subunit 11
MTTNKNNTSLALSLAAFVLGMVMMAYASVPLYRLFCQATGFGGVAQRAAEGLGSMTSRSITVRFDANVNSALAWSFKPAQTQVSVKLGEQKQVEYIAQNLGSAATTGTATFNITPVKAGGYFNKMQCFCFTRQTLGPHETRRLGVTFFIDPEMANNHDLDDVNTITLSYTFFPVDMKKDDR